MAFSIVGTPQALTQASTSLSQTYVGAAGDAEVILIISQRGGTGSPSAVSFGGVTLASGNLVVATDLAGITSSARGMRAYRVPRANHPGSGNQTVAVTWAGVDNIGVGVMEIRADGTISVVAQTPASNDDASLTIAIAALTGDLVISAAMANSGISWTPASGQTEYLESVWFNNTGHVVGVQNGPQSNANWTGSGSTCGVALVLREAGSGTSHTATGASCACSTDTPTVNQNHSLVANGASCATSVESPNVDENNSLTGVGVSCATSADSPSLNQLHNLSAIGANCAVTAESPNLDEAHALTGVGASCEVQAGTPTLVQNHALTALGASCGVSVEEPSLSGQLTALGASCGVNADSPSLAQRHNLIALGVSCACDANSPDLDIDQMLAIGVSCAVSVELPTLGQRHNLTAIGANCDTFVGIPVFNQTFDFAPPDQTVDFGTADPIIDFGNSDQVIDLNGN